MNDSHPRPRMHASKVGVALEELHRAENDLAGALLSLSDQQQANHEIFYVARDIARWSQEHVRRIADVGHDRGLVLGPGAEDETTLPARIEQTGAEPTSRSDEPGLLLLAELRHLHTTAAGVSLDWEVLAQTAQAMRDRELLDLAETCHPETLRQMRWANATVKTTAAQVMVTG